MQFPEENIPLLQQELSNDFNLPVTKDKQQLIEVLAEGINHLIQADFSRLLNILYRIDISEQTIKDNCKNKKCGRSLKRNRIFRMTINGE
jgi:hypothetical protein